MTALPPIPVDKTEGPPIFIVGNGRTGTTLMRLMLSAHPRIYICHEFWFYVWEKLFSRQKDSIEFLHNWAKTFNYSYLRLDKEEVLKRLPPKLPRKRVGEVFKETMKIKAASLGKPRYGEKTPGHVSSLKKIYRDFPDARVIVMVRDPRTTIASVGEMFWGAQRDLPNCIMYEGTRKAAGHFADRVLTVRLEDLRSNPRDTMEKVLEFVGEPWDDAVLEHAKHRDDPDDMPPVFFLNTAGQALVQGESRLQDLSPARVRLIETICGASMKIHGYEPLPHKNGAAARLSVAFSILSELPETVRYFGVWLSLVPALINSKRWGGLEQATDGRIRKLNPSFWKQHPEVSLKVPRPAKVSGD